MCPSEDRPEGLSERPAKPPSRPPSGRTRWGERGFVTAEAAVALPVMVLFTTVLLAGLMAVAAQIQCVDAARAGARAAARSEPDAAAVAAARSAAPRGAAVSLARDGELVRVRVTARAPLLEVALHAEAAALAEDTIR
ncbi:pilus assembly protein [Streptomyces sp. H39-S7]|nr:TadE family type IV pilus minor pilin [Streptomyces sp. H39-S7]MCZ4117821.1 pilus assembly protein [Streptomyces sp. H39-S7]